MDRVLLTLGPIKIYYYSVTMLIAILTGIYLAIKESKRVGMSSYISDLLISLIIFGIIGARLYYVIFNFSTYQNDILSILKIWEGGLAIYGAVIGGFVAIVYYAKKQKQSIIKTTDIIVPGLLLAQGIGRWGNFFNQEAHGAATSLEHLKSLHLPQFIINGMNINGIYYEPTFLYESLLCLIGFIIVLFIRRGKYTKVGTITSFYLMYYSVVRFLIESMRTDSLMLGGFKVAQIISIILFLIGLGNIMLISRKSKFEDLYNNVYKNEMRF